MRPGEPPHSTELEQALREMFAHRSAPPPGAADPAGRAIRRARRIQRRRSTLGLAMAVIATVAVSTLAPQIAATVGSPQPAFLGEPAEDSPGPDPQVSLAFTPPDTHVRRVEPPLVDVVVAYALHSARGQLINLSPVGRVVAARRADSGWLMVTIAPSSGSSLWFVREGSDPQKLLSSVDEVVVAFDGSRVAWREGARMFSAPITSGQLGTALPNAAPAGVRLVRLIGDRVLLAREGDTGYAVWLPQRDESPAPWVESVTAVHGLLPDGRTLVGQARVKSSPRPCLAFLDAERNLTPLRTACNLWPPVGEIGVVSPDGRWLIANRGSEKNGTSGPQDIAGARALVVDLDTAFGERPVVAEFDFQLDGEVAWIGTDTLVHPGRQADLLRVSVAAVDAGGTPKVDRVPVPAASTKDRVVMVSGCAAGTASAAPVVSCW